MKSGIFRWNFTGLSMIVFYGLSGLLLLLWPEFAVQIANYALAFGLLAVGLIMIIGYFHAQAMERMLGYGLSVGLILTLLGVILIINSNILATLLPSLWGIAMIAGGFGKFQMAFDLKHIKQKRWWLLLIGAGISFILGVVSVSRPAFVFTVITQFAGIALLIEAALDLTSLLIIKREIKHLKVEST